MKRESIRNSLLRIVSKEQLRVTYDTFVSAVDCKELIISNVVLLTIKHSNSELYNN